MGIRRAKCIVDACMLKATTPVGEIGEEVGKNFVQMQFEVQI